MIKNLPQHPLSVGYNGKYIADTVNIKLPNVQIDNHLNWTKHTDKLIPKLSGAGYRVRSMLYVSNTDMLTSSYCLFSFYNEVWNNFGG
jgi:hypothetical protein